MQYEYSYGQSSDWREANLFIHDMAENSWRLHTILCNTLPGYCTYQMVFEREIKEDAPIQGKKETITKRNSE